MTERHTAIPAVSIAARALLGRNGWRLLLLGAIAIFGLALLSGVIPAESMAAFDRAVFLSFRDPANPARLLGPRWLPEMLRDLTSLGSVLVVWLVTLLVCAYFALARRWHSLVLIFVSVAGGQVISTFTKTLINRARPDFIPSAPKVFTASFPSGHALLSAVTFLALGALLSELEPRRALKSFYIGVAIVLTGAIGISRVALGVHWPTDVLAGWCLGGAWAVLCTLVGRRLRRAHVVGPKETTDRMDAGA